MRRWTWCLMLVVALAAAGCPSDDPVPEPDAGIDGALADASDGAQPDTIKQVAPDSDPAAVTVKEWMVSVLPSSLGSDPVLAAIQQGTFTYPKFGYDANKIHWSNKTPGKDGALGKFPASIGWAVAKVTLKAPAHLFIRSGPTYGVWIDGVQRPGDVYASRSVWIPLPAKAGENLIAVRIAGGRAEPQIELWTSPDEVVLNEKDATLPDPLVGDTSEQCVGLPVLNLSDTPLLDLSAKVVASAHFEATAVASPGLGPRTVTQVAFSLKPKQAAAKAGEELSLTLRLESASLRYHYEHQLKLTAVGADTHYRRSRVSAVDGSCQYYGVLPPSSYDSSGSKKYALVLSLHGAGVEAINQAKSYSQKDWAFIVAPTNRRRYGFDWEVWGRLDAIEALDHAMQAFPVDPEQVYLTGHSMGGHGTWHVGVMHPGRFGVLAPSAGWSSFYSYGGSSKPTGVFARTQAHSDTNTYLSNLSQRGVYILHGGADTNVPTSEGQNMYKEVQKHTTDVTYHEEPGAGHWWDGSKAAGVDCVDWPALFAFIKARKLDPVELDFSFRTPAPWVNGEHAYVSILSQTDPNQDSTLTSAKSGTTVTLTTTNVRGMTLDGQALKQKGVTALVVDGKSVTLTDGEISVGATDGKRPGVHGPFNEVMYRPFCFVYADGASASTHYAQYAAYLASMWAVIGNGHACSLPLSKLSSVSASALAARNLIFVGAASKEVGFTPPLGWDASKLTVGSGSYTGALFLAYPRKDRLAAVIAATKGSEQLLFKLQPFTSRLVLPDYMVLGDTGVSAAGFFDAGWKLK